jgi:hypothetical protein
MILDGLFELVEMILVKIKVIKPQPPFVGDMLPCDNGGCDNCTCGMRNTL